MKYSTKYSIIDVDYGKLVFDFGTNLNRLDENNKNLLLWAPGHSNIQDYENLDSFARIGLENDFIGPEFRLRLVLLFFHKE